MHGGSCCGSESSSAARSGTVGVTTRAALSRKTSVDGATEPGARREPRGNADDEHNGYQHQCTCPSLLMPLVVRADGVGKDLERECSDGLTQTGRPELVSESSKYQRRRLTRDSGHRDERTGGDS